MRTMVSITGESNKDENGGNYNENDERKEHA